MHARGLLSWVAAGILLAFGGEAWAAGHFAYVSDRRIITAEPVSNTEVVLNVVNLSDEVMVLHAYDLLVRAGSTSGIGQVFERDERKEGEDPFFGTRLVKPREFVGLTIRGVLAAAPESVVFRSASRFFILEKLQPVDFDILGRKISEIDLKGQESEKVLRMAGISQGYGELLNYPEGETEALAALFPEVGQVLAPRVLVQPPPRATPGLPPDAAVEVKGLISRGGELLDASVSQGISLEADQRALNAVRNSWTFLPAVRDGQVVEATVTLRVKFTPP